jgi:hypothetical protein
MWSDVQESEPSTSCLDLPEMAGGSVNPKQLRPIVAAVLRDFYAKDI